MGSHSVCCYLTQVNASRLNSRWTGRYSIYLPRRDRRLSWSWCWLYTGDSLPICRRSSFQVVTAVDSDPTGSRIHDISMVSPTPYFYTTEPHSKSDGWSLDVKARSASVPRRAHPECAGALWHIDMTALNDNCTVAAECRHAAIPSACMGVPV